MDRGAWWATVQDLAHMLRVPKYIFTRMIVVKLYIKLQKETKKVNNQTTSPLI